MDGSFCVERHPPNKEATGPFCESHPNDKLVLRGERERERERGEKKTRKRKEGRGQG